jgi:hypothetical protein
MWQSCRIQITARYDSFSETSSADNSLPIRRRSHTSLSWKERIKFLRAKSLSGSLGDLSLLNDTSLPPRPLAGFVAKTKKTENGNESKIFINVVSSDKIAAPTKKSTPQGQNWSLPYSLGPPHMENDKGGDTVPAFDCCFHPEALQFGNRSKQFRDLLVSTAISGVEEAYRRQKQQVPLPLPLPC